MLTRNETLDLLSAVTAYDNREATPENVLAWQEAAHRGRWTFDEALDAVHAHYVETDKWLMPAHITERVRDRRRDALARETGREQIEAQRAIEAGREARVHEATANAFRAIGDDDQHRTQRRAALDRKCPHCGANPRQPCTRPSRGGPVPTRSLHPSRTEAA